MSVATSAPQPEFSLFAADAVVDYQLGGAYPPLSEVTVITRDSTAEPVPGLYSICYINGFQTQPGVAWPADLILYRADGEPLIDENWPDENVLDISSADKRSKVAALIGDSITSCAVKGFQAVEFDNFDSYTRSDGQLVEQDAITFATDLVAKSHALGMAAGQKNAADLVERGRTEVKFDFAVTEECDQFEECSRYIGAYGASVIDIEYGDELRRPFAEFCADQRRPSIAVLRDRNLVAVDAPGYLIEHC